MDDIKCSNKEMERILGEFTKKLKDEKSLYKDPLMLSNPITLKSKYN
jgi:hypothetical protein